MSKRRTFSPEFKQQEFDGFPLLVDSTVQVFPDALDLDAGFIDAPIANCGTLVFAGHLLDARPKSDRPSVNR